MRAVSMALAALLAAGLLAPAANAQGRGNRPRPGAGPGQALRGLVGPSLLQMNPALGKRLGLSAEQVGKIEEIRMRLGQEARAQFQAGQRPDQETLRKLRDTRDKGEREAVAVLSPEQSRKWDEIKAQHEKYRGLGRAGMGLLGVDGITSEQQQKLLSLAQESEAKRREIFQGAAQGDRQAAFQKMQQMDEQVQADIKRILSPEQVKQYEVSLPTGRLGGPGIRRQGGAPGRGG